MKTNILIFVLLLLFMFGCSPKVTSDNQVAKEGPVTHEPGAVGERDVVLPELSPEELGESQNFSKQLEGTYLPIKYVGSVSRSSSHLQSMRFFNGSSKEQLPSALTIEPEKLTKLYNFHEGVTEKIYRVESSRISTINGPRIVYTVNDDKTIQIDGAVYTRISNSVDSDAAISRFIVQKRLGVVDLASDHSNLRSDVEGNLFLNNKAIQIGLDLTLSQTEFDWARIEGEILFLRMIDNQVDILRARLKDGGSEWEFLPADAIFEVKESFMPRT